MIFEHFALNVHDPVAIKDWYCEYVGLSVVKEMKEPPYMLFLADRTGRVICELYHRPDFPITAFDQQHPLIFHFAMESANVEEDKQKLLTAGASLVDEEKKQDGTHLVMMRDPWGIPLQLCQRGKRMNTISLA